MRATYLIIAFKENRYQREGLDGEGELLGRQPRPCFGRIHFVNVVNEC